MQNKCTYNISSISTSQLFCCAISTSQLLLAIYSFQRVRREPRLSAQCMINGVIRYALEDANNINVEKETYEVSLCVALKFVQKKGCDLDVNITFMAQKNDTPFLRITDIQEDPSSIDVDSSVVVIRAAMEDYGCLVGDFEYNDTLKVILDCLKYITLKKVKML